MTSSDAAHAHFVELCARAELADLECAPIEPILAELLQFVLDHPEHRATFTEGFLAIMGMGPRERIRTPWETLPFCMHTLRWPEVLHAAKDYMDRATSQNDWRAINVLVDYIGSFEDDWERADMFERYTTKSSDET